MTGSGDWVEVLGEMMNSLRLRPRMDRKEGTDAPAFQADPADWLRSVTTQLMAKFVETFPGVLQFTRQLVKKVFL